MFNLFFCSQTAVKHECLATSHLTHIHLISQLFFTVPAIKLYVLPIFGIGFQNLCQRLVNNILTAMNAIHDFRLNNLKRDASLIPVYHSTLIELVNDEEMT